VEVDGFRTEISKAVLQILPVRLEADRLDRDSQQQAMPLVSVGDIHPFGPEAALELFLPSLTPHRLDIGKADRSQALAHFDSQRGREPLRIPFLDLPVRRGADDLARSYYSIHERQRPTSR